ncbi:MAG: hypothetical protein AAGJ29_13625 [Pseudomonadota bacterium]
MTKSPLVDDLAFARAMAEEGATAPSLSGRFAVMWGLLVTLALLAHWAVLRNILPIEPQYIGLIWLTMGVVGGIATAALRMTLRSKPGQSTAGNQAEAAGWPVVSLVLFSVAACIAASVFFRGQPPILFDMIIPMAFGFYTVMTALSARLFRTTSSQWQIWLSGLLAAGSAALLGHPDLYLLAAVGAVLTQIVPGILAMRAEPDAVV